MSFTYSQCIEYPEMNGPVTAHIPPSGWNVYAPSPDTTNPNSNCDCGPSPTGGTVLQMLVGPGFPGEAASTTVTGLTVGEEYYLAFWYCSETCGMNLGGSSLEITVNGDVYFFDTETSWTLIEICLVAEDIDMEIILEGLDGGQFGATLVDNIDFDDCDGNECCEPEEPTFDFRLDYCSIEDEFSLPMLSEEVIPGTWDIDPFDPGIYSDEFVTVTFTPDNDPGCDEEVEYEIYVNAFRIPEFSFPLEYCHPITETLELPSESDNGVGGTWDMDFIYLENYVDDEIKVTFTPDDPSCSEEVELYISVLETLELEFDLDSTYCQKNEFLDLPEKSKYGELGNWSVNPLDLSQPVGVYESRFVAEYIEGGECFEPFNYTYRIILIDSIRIEIDNVLCRSNLLIELDSFSLDSIKGSWSVPAFRTDTVTGNSLSSLWTPLPGQSSCYDDTLVTFQIIESVIPAFSLPSELCDQDPPFLVPEYSQNDSIHGIWNVPVIDPSGLGGGFITIEFTPDNDECAINFSHTVEIIESISPEFKLVDTMCRMESPITFASVSDNSISGQWTTNPIDPANVQGSEIQNVFTPDDLCHPPFVHTITILDQVDPVFDLPSYFCVADPAYVLPQESINGIMGTWTVPEIIPGIAGNLSLESTFIPMDHSCAVAYTYTSYIQGDISWSVAGINPTNCTTLNGKITIEILDPELEYSMDGDNWQNDDFDLLPAGTYTIYVRNSNYPLCTQSDELVLSAPMAPEILSVDIDDVSSCLTSNGMLTITASGIDLEYSIDGDEWQDSNVFSDLESGSYTILIREMDNPDCMVNGLEQIDEPALPVIISVNSDDPTSCTIPNGSLELIATGSDLEFSLDGLIWQNPNQFTGLAAGIYEVYAREKDATDCLAETTTELVAPDVPTIQSVLPQDVSSCTSDNGSLTITAIGNDLEYSIDGGLSWETTVYFDELSAGVYDIYVREAEAPDCVAVTMTEIFSSSLPFIQNIATKDVSSCLTDNGSLAITATGTNLEYSIDGGQNWVTTDNFDELGSGTYEVLVRSISDPDCVTGEDVTIDSVQDVEIQNIMEKDPSTCSPLSGELQIIATGTDLEYSIDGGNNWQSSNVFAGLDRGTYQVLIRDAFHPDCMDTDQAELEMVMEQLPDSIIGITPVSDCGLSDGSITIQIDASDISFSIDGGNTWQVSDFFPNLSSAMYTLWVRHDLYADCEIQLDFELIEPDCSCPDLLVESSTTPVYCVAIDNGIVSLDRITGYEDGIDQITWGEGQSGNSIGELGSGWYSYIIAYDDDCVWNDSIFVEEIDPLTFGLMTFDPECEGDENGKIEVVEVVGGNGGLNYSIDGIEYQDENVFYDLSPQEYLVYVLDQENCLESELIAINEGLILSLELPEIETVDLGDSIFLNPLINEATIDSFTWSPQLDILNPGELVAEILPKKTTEYTLTVYFGECIELRTILIKVNSVDEKIYMPNTINVNDNGTNKYLIPYTKDGSQIDKVQLFIFDRWGNKIYENDDLIPNDPSEGWDGTYNGQKLIPGVYVYKLSYVLNGQTIIMVDDVTVF